MMPLEPHEPPRAVGTLHTVRIMPLLTSTTFNLPSAKKPILALSGDQKGFNAPRTPETIRSVPLRNERIQSSPPAPKTSELPSGESAGCVPMSPSISKDVPAGGMIDEKTGKSGAAPLGRIKKSASAAMQARAARDQARSSRRFFLRGNTTAAAD